jgi:hypothetical protein
MSEKGRSSNDFAGDEDEPLHPQSSIIAAVKFGPTVTIGTEGDIWATTWAGDDKLYVVYCDGMGFERLPERLSTGFSIVHGIPPDVRGENTPSSMRYTGHRRAGRKVSGIIAFNDGGQQAFYVWIRNYNARGGSTVAWSTDYCKTWTEAAWHFPELGHPSWLNAGRNYERAIDDYLYFYTQDQPVAYVASDSVIMGRVHRSRAQDKASYEFCCGFDAHGEPQWSHAIDERKPILTDPGRVYRVYVDYNHGIDRYILLTACGGGLSENYRGSGHNLGIYESPRPWGPWSTVFWTDEWDRLENRFAPHIPAPWISDDGLTFYIVFSCNPKGSYKMNAQKVTLVRWTPFND